MHILYVHTHLNYERQGFCGSLTLSVLRNNRVKPNAPEKIPLTHTGSNEWVSTKPRTHRFFFELVSLIDLMPERARERSRNNSCLKVRG